MAGIRRPSTTPSSSGDSDSSSDSGQRRADRTDHWLTRLVALACVVLVIVGVGRSLLGVTVFGSTDTLYQFAPWSSQVAPGFEPANQYVGDPVDSIFPPLSEAVDRLHSGDIPAWTSLQLGGSELGVAPGLAMLSPVSLPYLVMPIWLAPAYVKLLEIAFALGGMYLYCRRIGLGRAGGWLGGLAFVTCGFLIAWTNWQQTRTAAFIPALFWALERVLQERTARSGALVALSVAALLAGGFPSVTAYALFTAAPYVLVRVAATELGRRGVPGAARRVVTTLGLAAAGVVAGAALLAVQLLPFLRQLGAVDLNARTQTPDQSLTAVSLVTSLVPNALGAPVSHLAWLGPRNPIESFSYVGVVVALLAGIGLLGLRAGAGAGAARGVRSFLLVAIVGWGVAVYRGGPALEAIQHLPTMDINPIARARSVLGFFLAVLAAIGVDALVRARSPAPAPRSRTLVGTLRWLGWAVLAVAVVRLVLAGRAYASEEGFSSSFLRATAVAGGVLVVALAGVLLAARATGRARVIGLALLPIVVLAPAAATVQPWWPESPRASFYPATPTHDFLAAHLGSDRFVSTDDAMVPGSNLAYGLRSLDGHAFIRPELADLLRAIDPASFVAPTLWHPHLEAATSTAAAPLLDRLAVKYVVAPPDAPVVGVQRIIGGGGDIVPWAPGMTLALNLDGPSVRGVGIVLAADPGVVEATITVRLFGADDAVVGATSRRITAGDTKGPVTVAVAAPAAAVRAELTLQSARPLELVGHTAPQVVRVDSRDDGLEVVHTGDTTIYERATSLPRIRWATTETSGDATGFVVDLLRSGDAPDVIVDGLGTGDATGPAELTVLEDSGDTVRVRVDARGAGYLVVADAIGDTFTATLDGEPTRLGSADHGYVAVAVPYGAHEVELTYRSPGGRLGAVVSALAALLILGALAWRRRAPACRRRPVGAARRG